MAIIECAGCGKKADSAWDVCPDCGANPATGEIFQEEIQEETKRPTVDYSRQSLGFALFGWLAFGISIFGSIGDLGTLIGIVVWTIGATVGYRSWRRHRRWSAFAGLLISLAGLGLCVIIVVLE